MLTHNQAMGLYLFRELLWSSVKADQEFGQRLFDALRGIGGCRMWTSGVSPAPRPPSRPQGLGGPPGRTSPILHGTDQLVAKGCRLPCGCVSGESYAFAV